MSFGLGEADRAMELFDQACEEKDGILIYLPVDPLSESLVASPGIRRSCRKCDWQSKLASCPNNFTGRAQRSRRP